MAKIVITIEDKQTGETDISIEGIDKQMLDPELSGELEKTLTFSESMGKGVYLAIVDLIETFKKSNNG